MPVAGLAMEQCPQAGYEIRLLEFRFSDVRVGDKMAPSLFVIRPPPGTNVVDEVAGYSYTAGPAGEQLEKAALPPRDHSASAEPRKHFRFLLLGLAPLALVTACAAVFAVVRYRCKRAA